MNWKPIFPGGWYEQLEPFINDGGMDKIYSYLGPRITQGKKLYPPSTDVFKAFQLTPLDKVKVVIIGVEPTIHGDGLAFSSNNKIYPGPIYGELFREKAEEATGRMILELSDLSEWAKQGVFLYNTSLTSEGTMYNAHHKLWEKFTEWVFSALMTRPAIVYLLWGNHAVKYQECIDSQTAYLLHCGYPGNKMDDSFMLNNHFADTNKILTEVGKALGEEDYTIKW